jgi:hypothetical protein
MKDNYPYQQAQQGIGGVTTGYLNIGQVMQSQAGQTASRLTLSVGRLQAQVANYSGFTDRLARIADRLSGAVPEAVNNQNKASGTGNSVAGMFDAAQDDFDAVSQRLNAIIERLEAL